MKNSNNNNNLPLKNICKHFSTACTECKSCEHGSFMFGREEVPTKTTNDRKIFPMSILKAQESETGKNSSLSDSEKSQSFHTQQEDRNRRVLIQTSSCPTKIEYGFAERQKISDREQDRFESYAICEYYKGYISETDYNIIRLVELAFLQNSHKTRHFMPKDMTKKQIENRLVSIRNCMRIKVKENVFAWHGELSMSAWYSLCVAVEIELPVFSNYWRRQNMYFQNGEVIMPTKEVYNKITSR